MSEYVFLQDNFLTVTPGEPIRLLPLGKLVKGGKVRELTKELLSKFRLPTFLPPIKIGSHKDEAPAGGHIKALEVREDGLYAIPEYNEEGQGAVARGDFRYHSPEIVWEGGFEDSETGDVIEGPLVVGMAFLHMPHLGERASLYSFEETNGGIDTMDFTFADLKELFSLSASLAPAPTPEPEPVDPPFDVDAFQAELTAEKEKADALQAELDAIKEKDDFEAKIGELETKLGEGVPGEVAPILAKMEEEDTAVLIQAFAALAEQAKHNNLEEDLGNSGTNGTGTPIERYNAAVNKYMEDNPGVMRDKAAVVVAREHPELLEA